MNRRPREFAFDLGLALALLAVNVSTVLTLTRSSGPRALGLTLVVAHVLPVAFRRRAPLAVQALCALTGALALAAGFPTVVLGLALLVTTYTSAATRPRAKSLLALAGVIALLGPLAIARADTSVSTAVVDVLVLGAVWLLGDGVRERGEGAARAREDAMRRAVADERLRIARELHDVVAHALSVVAVQSGAARFAATRDPAAVTGALETIETTSRAALAEMRNMLGALRGDDAGRDPALDPQPTLDGLAALVAQVRQAGVPVTVTVEGTARALPPGLELSAYRIVQEALTNVIRHAGPVPARVAVRYEPDRIGIEVVDDGAPVTAVGTTGHGLVGMRERVALYGGTLDVGPRPGGGFRVAASLPVRAASLVEEPA